MAIQLLSMWLVWSVVIISILAYQTYKYYKQEQLRKWVSFCVNSPDLIYELGQIQQEAEIPQEYRITSSEEVKMANEIIKAYQSDLASSFFKNQLRTIRSEKYVINNRLYFAFTLCSFLHKHQCDYKFQENDMHKERLSYKSYGSWGAELFDSSYSLSSFGMLYHKIYYMCYMRCRNSPQFNHKRTSYSYPENIQKILDTGIIHISRI